MVREQSGLGRWRQEIVDLGRGKERAKKHELKISGNGDEKGNEIPVSGGVESDQNCILFG